MEEKKILIKDVEVNYKIFGEGKPLLILHGWGSSSDKWVKVAELLVQKNIQVVVPDFLGFGKSNKPDNALNLDNYVEWIYEFSQKVPELRKNFYLLGHSFGGAVAIKFAIKYNQKAERLFLVSASCIRKRTFIKKVYYRISKIIKIFSFLPYYQLVRKAFYKFIIKKSDYLYFDGVMQETYLRIISEDLSWRLSSVKVLTILIWGQKDDLTTIEQAEFINKKISHSKLFLIPEAKHALEIEVPEILAQKILENLPFPNAQGEILSLKNII